MGHLGSYLQGHPPGVDMSSGSLGQGISAAVGMALGAKMDGKGVYKQDKKFWETGYRE